MIGVPSSLGLGRPAKHKLGAKAGEGLREADCKERGLAVAGGLDCRLVSIVAGFVFSAGLFHSLLSLYYLFLSFFLTPGVSIFSSWSVLVEHSPLFYRLVCGTMVAGPH